MNDVINEQNYPIQRRWILESIIGCVLRLAALFSLILIVPSGSRWASFRDIFWENPWAWVLYVFFTFLIVADALQRVTFHYSIEDGFLTLRQGVLTREESQIPYGGIQDIFVKQDLLDRVFGLATLTIEHVPYANIDIQGLAKPSAEMLRRIVLQEMKENPIENAQSGL